MVFAVEGNRGWEIMDGLDRTMSDWLGEEPTRRMRDSAKVVQSVSFAPMHQKTYTYSNEREMRGSLMIKDKYVVVIETISNRELVHRRLKRELFALLPCAIQYLHSPLQKPTFSPACLLHFMMFYFLFKVLHLHLLVCITQAVAQQIFFSRQQQGFLIGGGLFDSPATYKRSQSTSLDNQICRY